MYVPLFFPQNIPPAMSQHWIAEKCKIGYQSTLYTIRNRSCIHSNIVYVINSHGSPLTFTENVFKMLLCDTP